MSHLRSPIEICQLKDCGAKACNDCLYQQIRLIVRYSQWRFQEHPAVLRDPVPSAGNHRASAQFEFFPKSRFIFLLRT